MSPIPISSRFRAVGCLVRFLLALSVTVPSMLILRGIGHPARERVARRFHAASCRAFGIEIEVRGEQGTAHPTLFVSNHTSYLDIVVLGGLVRGYFVAKKEIAGWPVFGFLVGLQETIYVERRARYAAGQRDALSERLLEHKNVILFPEGTSNDGNHIKPFKSALFSVAELKVDDRPISVQPVSITYTRLDGIPLGRHLRPLVAWYGDMELLSHAWRLLGLGNLTAVVEFHEPVTIDGFGSRKELAEYCMRQVGRGMATALSGQNGRGTPAELAAPADSPSLLDAPPNRI